ncbi:MAG: CHAT domain-containing protein [Bacteroidetes bacterium]|nr:CHAT domain-containing protein [Bacteroidota bacterium]
MGQIVKRILGFEFHQNHITYVKSSNGSSKPANFEKEKIKLELSISRIFHKALNKTRVEGLFEKNDLETFGYILYKLLCLSDPDVNSFVNREFKTICRDSSYRGIIPLRFAEEAAYLAMLPWEYLQILENVDKDFPTFYLTANRERSFDLVRHIDTGNEREIDPSFSNQKQLNILQIICQSKRGGLDIPDFQNIFSRLDKEFLDDDGNPVLTILAVENPSASNFRKRIKEIVGYFSGEYIVHFYGHARMENDEANIALVAEDKSEEWVNQEVFTDFFNGSGDFKKPLSVLLQACESGQINSKGQGLAPSLIHANIPYVIGMQNEVTTDVSNAFFYTFYRALLSGHDFFRSVTEGRVHLGCEYNKDDPEETHKHYTDNSFGTPVLFSDTVEALKFFPERTQTKAKETRFKLCNKCRTPYDFFSDFESCPDPRCRGQLIYMNSAKAEATPAPSSAASASSVHSDT